MAESKDPFLPDEICSVWDTDSSHLCVSVGHAFFAARRKKDTTAAGTSMGSAFKRAIKTVDIFAYL